MGTSRGTNPFDPAPTQNNKSLPVGKPIPHRQQIGTVITLHPYSQYLKKTILKSVIVHNSTTSLYTWRQAKENEWWKKNKSGGVRGVSGGTWNPVGWVGLRPKQAILKPRLQFKVTTKNFQYPDMYRVTIGSTVEQCGRGERKEACWLTWCSCADASTTTC